MQTAGSNSMGAPTVALFVILFISVIGNIILFLRGRGSYSVKYQIFFTSQFFRQNPSLCIAVQVIYKVFFAVPFGLLILISILQAFVQPLNFLTININGLIVLLTIYPIKPRFFYIVRISVWILVIFSQLNTLFLRYNADAATSYTLLCCIFYPINCIIFCFSLLAHQQDYWELNQAISICEQELKGIYPFFLKPNDNKSSKPGDGDAQAARMVEEVPSNERRGQESGLARPRGTKVYSEMEVKDFDHSSPQHKKPDPVKQYNIPAIFDGGLYGSLCRFKGNRGLKRGLMYFGSLLILALNAILIRRASASDLGVVGLITNFIYDIFIFAFTSIKTPERSVRNTFILVFVGRVFSFVFGQQLWIFGYCALYLVVGIFIGRIIVNRRLPLKAEKRSKAERHKREQQNALKTPEFVLFILTAEIFLLVAAASYGVGGEVATYQYNAQVSIPLWQFAIIAVIITWIVILLMASQRMYQRQKNNIHQNIEYYFGITWFREFHVYIIITYGMVVVLGMYFKYFIMETTAFLSCFFIPLILLCLNKLEAEWVKNQYQLLAEIKEHNERVVKAKRIIEKKKLALKNQVHKKGNLIQDSNSKVMAQQLPGAADSSGMGLISGNPLIQQNDPLIEQSETSTQMQQQMAVNDELKQLSHQQQQLIQIEHDWRKYEGRIGPKEFFMQFITSSDRWILLMILAITVLSLIYSLLTFFVSGTIFGILVVLCMVNTLTMSPFMRYGRTFKDIVWYEFLWFYFGWLLGIIYWSIYRSNTFYAIIWSVCYILSAGSSVLLGLFRNIKKMYIYILLANIAATGLFICIILFATIPLFPAALATMTLCLIGLGTVPVAYNYLEGTTPMHVKLICGGLIILGVVTMAVVAYVLQVASNFAIFSFLMWSGYIVLFLVATAMFIQHQQNKFQCPHVYSAYGLPVYKFDSRTEKLKPSITHKVIYDLAGIVVIVYSATVTLLFEQKAYAVYALSYYIMINFLQQMLFAFKTHNQLAEQKDKVTTDIVSKALKDLSSKYMVDFKSESQLGSKGVDDEKYKLKELAENQTQKERLNEAYSKLARKHQQWVNVVEEEQKFLFFWTALIVFGVFNQRKNEMMKLISQAKEIEADLMEFGIFIESLNFAITDVQAKYEMVVKEIESLNPFDFINYQKLLERNRKLAELRAEQQRKKSALEQQQHKRREKQVFDQINKQAQKSGDERINEFNQMIAAIQSKKRYTDTEFPADQTTLGSMNSIVQKWRRPKKGQTLVKGQINGFDVKQGSIGDCYLISSMGVLGDTWIKRALGMSDVQGWQNSKGAYMVRFFKFLKKVYIIVDDQLPVDAHDTFVFARSEDPQEIWPSILQKAYAKLYGGYHQIVQGKCHRVFAEFTGGFPEEINIDQYKSNPNGLWQRIVTSQQNKYLLAAGSPSHADGDRAHSATGIVQGHAYSILDVREVEGNRLIQLKNPHGSGGLEWNGDFSDESQLMSKRLMALIGYEKKDDGVFWMNVDDFIKQFSSLYVCAIFDDTWLKIDPIRGNFTQQNSYGIPKSNDQTYRNPQFGIRVTCKCTLFVSLSQKAENSIKGQNTIYLRIQRNEGKRIAKHNTKTDLLCGRQLSPVDAITMSNEALLEADQYPYVFTLFISCMEQGDIGQYTVEMYCSDKAMTVIPDAQFDRELF